MASNPVSYELLYNNGLVGNLFGITRNPSGIYIKLINKTGANSIKGTILQISSTNDDAVELSSISSSKSIGIMYENDIPDGQLCTVIITGVAEVLLENGQSATRGYWCGTSSTAGRAYTLSSTPVLSLLDFSNTIGYCMENKTSGTNILVKVMLKL